MLSGLSAPEVMRVQKSLADSLFRQIPAGVGSTGAIALDDAEMDAMLAGGARWAIERGWGEPRDLERIEERGRMADAMPDLSPNGPRNASGVRWAHWARVTTILKFRPLLKFLMPRLPRYSA